MSFYNNKVYMDDLLVGLNSTLNINKLNNKSIMITGASGLIGSYIVDILLLHNKINNANIKIYAVDLDYNNLIHRFIGIEHESVVFVEHNVNDVPNFEYSVDYIIHAASNAYPVLFNQDPVGTMMSNFIGTKNLLDFALKSGTKRLLYISSGEIYGQGNLNLDSFSEDYSGYVNPIVYRSCYPNSKRAAETLCVSYTKQYSVDTVVVRPSHTYGANATKFDNRANVQFVNNAIKGENIILYSSGSQLRSYTYITDTASAILTVLINGGSCEAYNIANKNSIVSLLDFAKIVARFEGVEVKIVEPDEKAIAEHNPIIKQVLDSTKLESIGWTGKYDVETGISHTLQCIKGC